MKVVLELQGQRSNIKRVTVRHDIVIGRATECNLRVSSPQVSRRHCFLRVSSNGVTITDLDSANGTWLDGEKIVPGKRYPVEDGMTLNVGPVRFVAKMSSDQLTVRANGHSDVGATQAFEATIPPNLSEFASMDFSIEHAGPSADDDEPTVDYSAEYATGPASDLIVADDFAQLIDPDDVEVIGEGELPVEALDVEAIVVSDSNSTAFDVIDDIQVIDDVNVVDDVDVPEDIEVLHDVEVADEVDVIEGVEVLRELGAEPIPDPANGESIERQDSGSDWFPSASDVDRPIDAELQKFLSGQ